MNLALYQIEQQYMILADLLISNGGEVTDEISVALKINQNDLEQKGKGYGYIIKDIEAEVDVISTEIARLTALKKARVNSIERLKTTLSDAMILFGINELKTATLKISFRKSESVEIENESLLDAKFMTVKITHTPNKTLIKEAIKNGESVMGACISENLNLQIK